MCPWNRVQLSCWSSVSPRKDTIQGISTRMKGQNKFWVVLSKRTITRSTKIEIINLVKIFNWVSDFRFVNIYHFKKVGVRKMAKLVKVIAHQAWGLEFDLHNLYSERTDWLLQVILWPPYTHCGVCAPTYLHTDTQREKYIFKKFSSPKHVWTVCWLNIAHDH